MDGTFSAFHNPWSQIYIIHARTGSTTFFSGVYFTPTSVLQTCSRLFHRHLVHIHLYIMSIWRIDLLGCSETFTENLSFLIKFDRLLSPENPCQIWQLDILGTTPISLFKCWWHTLIKLYASIHLTSSNKAQLCFCLFLVSFTDHWLILYSVYI